MTSSEIINGLFSILWQYDNTWEFYWKAVDNVELMNSIGIVVSAPDLESALHAALALYGERGVNDTYRY